ncbi:RNA-binding domain-containing protein [Rhizoclosmatium globosum]|uniref:Pre-mRNA-splicing factor SLT11 n=1 Tax=Rhizoclosmatium globosum TaxID=329046 RepID=A0A1Y2CYK5_9FUNG|nr:RNA binding motif protein 22 [Rhizoclosmatium sp. JEL0117]ORY51924.1 RNA-binding domain-containing protein [Rhizoclosmatium globosum]|eukprot:ORY51924.1 RNA-binding domain-containing protein [Rhizoclosmatium globosum]
MSGAKMQWEKGADFPILCETCLGDNPYVRMTKQTHGKECKICARPFTVFRWCPGAGMRYKKTEICQTCAKIKNVCQTCVLDLEYGLPVQVRDSVLEVQDSVPRSDVNREYFINRVEGTLGQADTLVNYSKAESVAKVALKSMARTEPFYQRNRAHICSFYVKGECKRGEECPFRHELPPADSEMAHQNIKDRYYGTNDPVAKKMLSKAGNPSGLQKPHDTTITSLFITGVEFDVTEDDLREHFHPFGEIKSIVVVTKTKTAFVNFTYRAAAEAAASKLYNNLNIKGHVLRVQWGKSRSATGAVIPAVSAAVLGGPIDPDLLPTIPPPPGTTGIVYASTDPGLLGSSLKNYRA